MLTCLENPVPTEPFTESDIPLLPIQRRQRIADFMQNHGAVTLQQLTEALHVSLSTLRRDLDHLAEDGLIERTHGGAVLRHQQYNTFEPHFSAALDLSPHEKAVIGAAAAEALIPGQSVIFDSGSTVLEAAKAVVARRIEILAITNNIEIAQVLNSSPLIQVHVFGGMLRYGSNTLIGDAVQMAAKNIHADVLLLGAHAVTENVVSETSPEVASVKNALMKSASVCRLLVDGSKFRPRVFMSVCDVADVDEVITDDSAPQEELERIRASGTLLTVVKSGKA
jgi:DeoR family transcriptional regulator of aga operon